MYAYGIGAGALAVKRRRIAGDRGLVPRELWVHGVVPAMRRARHGQYAAAAGALVRSAGVLSGVRRARRRELRQGRFA
jgi:hypothetical protein